MFWRLIGVGVGRYIIRGHVNGRKSLFEPSPNGVAIEFYHPRMSMSLACAVECASGTCTVDVTHWGVRASAANAAKDIVVAPIAAPDKNPN
jgi:hypothetical protein